MQQIYQKRYRSKPGVKEAMAERQRAYRAKNIDKVRAWARKSVAKARLSGKADGLAWYHKNKERAAKNHRAWNLKNKLKIKGYNKEWAKRNPIKNANRKIAVALRGRVRDAVVSMGMTKSIKTISLIGCSLDFARKHIESKFKDGMSWENQGRFGWHLDHIKPCSKFDLTNVDEQKKCFHYTNLQPLWWRDNIIKGGKWEEPQKLSEMT